MPEQSACITPCLVTSKYISYLAAFAGKEGKEFVETKQ